MTAYSDLLRDISFYALRVGDTDFEAAVPGFVRLAEAHLNRELQPLFTETDLPLTGEVGSRFLALPGDFVEPISLHLTTGSCYIELRPDVAGEMPLQTSNGRPNAWAINGSNIQIDTPCDAAHSFALRYRAKFALSEAKPTNWLIENHPDVYLAASLGWGAAFVMDDPQLAKWKAIAEEAVNSIGWQASRSRLTTATVDPALLTSRFSITHG